MSESRPKQFVAVLDFGAQYGQLIARRVRDLNVYSEIVPCDISADELRELNPSALILSGGPASVYAEDAPKIDPRDPGAWPSCLWFLLWTADYGGYPGRHRWTHREGRVWPSSSDSRRGESHF